ncbi:MAG: hypothetical protein ACFFB3_10715 [Candidatus Hodarchaeota archaeon]
MKSDQLNSFGWEGTVFEFKAPEKVDSILFWDSPCFDHRVIAKALKVSPQTYANDKMQHIADFFGLLDPLSYVGSLKVSTEDFLNLFLNSLPFPSSIDLSSESNVDEEEFKLVMLLMTLFPLEESFQTLVTFVSSHANGDVALICVEVEPGVFMVLSALDLFGNSLLWESLEKWEPKFFYCPETSNPPYLFS